jgi:hypothetical protein
MTHSRAGVMTRLNHWELVWLETHFPTFFNVKNFSLKINLVFSFNILGQQHLHDVVVQFYLSFLHALAPQAVVA